MSSRHLSFLFRLLLALCLPIAVNADDAGSLIDRFDDSTTDTEKWTVGTLSLYQGASLTDSSIPVTEENGHLKIVPRAQVSSLHYNGYVSKDKYDFFGGRFTVEIVEIPNPASTGEMFISVGADGRNLYRFEIHMGQLRADIVTNGIPIYYPLGRFGSSNGIPPYSPPGQYGDATPAYSPPRQDSLPNYHHLRIRHDPLANRILWEASTNRIEWTTLYSNSPAFPLTNVQVELFAGTYTPTASPGVAVFDNAELSKISLVTNQPPQILTQPQSKTVAIGQSATFNVEASSFDPISYQWFLKSFFIRGATSAVFAIPNAQTTNAGTYRVRITNKSGEVLSAPAELTVLGQGTQPPFIITQPKNVTNVVEGDTATFTVVAEGAGAGPLEYQWLKDSQPITGAIEATLTLSDLKVGSARYQVIVRNALGSITSNPALLLVWPKAPPIISGCVGPREVFQGELVSLLVTLVSVSPVTYQWFKNDVPIPGATELSYVIGAAKVEDSGNYKLSISNPFGTTVSDLISVLVHNTPPPPQIPPKIAASQDRLTVVRGNPFVLSISILAGTPPFEYHWLSDHPAGNATTSYSVEHAQFSDTGQYHVNVTNPYGSDGAVFNVTVVDLPTVVKQPAESLVLLPYLPGSLSARFSTGVPNLGGPNGVLTWYRNGRPVFVDYVYHTNEYESSITIASTDNPNRPGPGDYVAVFDNGSGGVTSKVAHVEVVIPAPKRPPVSNTPDLKRDLVAYWPFDNAEGNKIRDHFGHHDLELGPDATFLPGQFGNALKIAEWGAIAATYRAAGPEDELPINRHPAFTISFWDNFLPKTFAGDPPYFFLEGDSDNPNTRFAIAEEARDPNSVDLTAIFRFVQPAKENVELHTDLRTLSVQEWRHVVFVQDEDGSRWLYIDGIEAPLSIPPRPAGEWKVNYTQIGGTQRLPGTLSALFICCFPGIYLVDETAVWKRALNHEEIRLLHRSGISAAIGPPIIDSQSPTSITLRKGQPLVLAVAVLGESPFQYRWFKDSKALPDAASPIFTIPESVPSDSGAYQVVVSNAQGSTSSEKISVSVLGDAPIITIQPPGQTVLSPGETVSLPVEIRSLDSPTITWYHNGEKQVERPNLNPSGESTRFFDALPLYGWGGPHRVVAEEEAGDWFAVASNSSGSTTSSITHVEVILPTPRRPPGSDAPDVRKDLVAYWPLDEAADGKTKDLVGHYDLVLSNAFFAPARNQAGLQFSFAETFQTARFESGNPEDELPINRHPAFTISLWNQLHNSNSGGFYGRVPYYFREGDTENPNTAFTLIPDFKDGSDAQFVTAFRFVHDPAEHVDVSTNRYISALGEWRHLVFVQEENGKRWFYIDGIESDIAVPPKPPGAWKVNYTQLGGTERIQNPGLSAMVFCCIAHSVTIDDLAVWKRALSANEIQLLMANGIPGFEAKPFTIKSLTFKDEGKTVVLNWHAPGDGFYSLLKSATVSGPWTVVTNGYPYGANGYYSRTNSFTDTTAQGTVFYQIQKK